MLVLHKYIVDVPQYAPTALYFVFLALFPQPAFVLVWRGQKLFNSFLFLSGFSKVPTQLKNEFPNKTTSLIFGYKDVLVQGFHLFSFVPQQFISLSQLLHELTAQFLFFGIEL
jgi:hypothetical protein